MEKFKKFMSSPYTRGDYYGGIAAVMTVYAIGCGIAFALIRRNKRKNIESFNDEVHEMDENSSKN